MGSDFSHSLIQQKTISNGPAKKLINKQDAPSHYQTVSSFSASEWNCLDEVIQLSKLSRLASFGFLLFIYSSFGIQKAE